ncbi:flagellar basal body rod protein [Caldifermentibacillus hisashii]|uniref:lmo0954 family membrane protein n=1 Tax=Bacillaceae TaxID=186817 RepID=UPI001C110695|nr:MULTISPECIES: flagellar basal body rod protein [Bacillaceae]MBU5341489.1 flagellar basal body rod protein [Caldifermentibacillus hisashii]MCM3478401.1 flagellar basal body rod protein [Caldibacillus thermoamylovorans]MED4850367.1 flagellar basal body rod protein [Caldifermentibacillus hisashii]
MKKFLLFVGGLAALLILLANLGPIVLLALSVWLLYIIFKKFIRSDSTLGKIGWVILGLIVFGIAFSNIYAIIGVAAAFALYYIYKSWKKDDHDPVVGVMKDDDPFTNFEREWAELNK